MEINGNGSGGVAPTPSFTLRTLEEIQRCFPRSFWERFMKIRKKREFAKVRPGAYVRVMVQSVGHQKNPCEVMWLFVRHVDHKARKYIGEVATRTDDLRSGFHGLKRRMLISFEAKHILGVDDW